ncbi:MAG TPA: hypothetical protein PKD37_03575 [Oligoflexia bacterium]|nr:hypothetical protein [Oligoflexia bacterium]HMP27049.1 hypothetical protein [Oligoflexia bacterium]
MICAREIFVRIKRTFLVKRFFLTCRNFAVANKSFLLSPVGRIYSLKVVIGLSFIFGFLFSLRLWTASRFYPVAPIFYVVLPIARPIDWIILFAIFGFLATVVLSAKPKIFIWIAITIILLLVFLTSKGCNRGFINIYSCLPRWDCFLGNRMT